METYIVRQPILDQNKKTVAYEILYQEDATTMYNSGDSTAANIIEQFLMGLSDERFLAGQKAYLTFTPNLLMKNIPHIFSEERLVIQIEDSALVHPVAQQVIYRYKKQGYRIAMKGFEFSPRHFGILDAVDVLKLDFSNPDDPSLPNIVHVGRSFQKDIVAYNIATTEALERARELGCNYFQGSYLAQEQSSKVHRMEHMQSNFFQLMIALTKDEPDVDEIAEIISRDVTLAFSLLKLVNSAYFALRNPAKSIKQALLVLGLGQLKQWVYLLSFKQEGDASEEIIKTSFLRANFCAALSKHVQGLPVSPAECYLLGMFSTLGILMEVPLEQALAELALSEEIKQALLTGEGMCGELYHLVLCYENADWRGMTQHAQALGIPMNMITQIYFEGVENVNAIWNAIGQSGEEAAR